MPQDFDSGCDSHDSGENDDDGYSGEKCFGYQSLDVLSDVLRLPEMLQQTKDWANSVELHCPVNVQPKRTHRQWTWDGLCLLLEIHWRLRIEQQQLWLQIPFYGDHIFWQVKYPSVFACESSGYPVLGERERFVVRLDSCHWNQWLLTFWLKVFPHRLQGNRSSLLWVLIWVCMFPFCEKLFPQTSQANGFSFVWTLLSWVLRFPLWVNPLPQDRQLKSFSPVWIFMCVSTFPFWVKLLPQICLKITNK